MDQLSEGRLLMGMASGWYKREFDAAGVPFEKRGKIMDENLEILKRLWTEPKARRPIFADNLEAVMYPEALSASRAIPILIGGYVDRVLQARGDAGDGWLTYFYQPESSPSRGTRSAISPRRPARIPTPC